MIAAIITVRDGHRDGCHHGRLIITIRRTKISMPTSIESDGNGHDSVFHYEDNIQIIIQYVRGNSGAIQALRNRMPVNVSLHVANTAEKDSIILIGAPT